MENRLSRITTRSGDDGSTGLADGQRLFKDDPRIGAMGDIDELNSQLGLLLTEPLPPAVQAELSRVQHELFDLGSELALPGHAAVDETQVVALEAALERFNADLPPLKEFILPGGSRAAALAHVCRCVARRAERSVVAAAHHDPQAVGPHARRYLNRLSDLLFVCARVIHRQPVTPGAASAAAAPAGEVYWRSRRLREAGDA